MRESEIRDSRIPAHISDDALDDYITELIVEEARMKDPAYQREYQRLCLGKDICATSRAIYTY